MQQNQDTVLGRRAPSWTDASRADFGTPISIAARRGGRPKGVSPGQMVVPGRIVHNTYFGKYPTSDYLVNYALSKILWQIDISHQTNM